MASVSKYSGKRRRKTTARFDAPRYSDALTKSMKETQISNEEATEQVAGYQKILAGIKPFPQKKAQLSIHKKLYFGVCAITSCWACLQLYFVAGGTYSPMIIFSTLLISVAIAVLVIVLSAIPKTPSAAIVQVEVLPGNTVSHEGANYGPGSVVELDAMTAKALMEARHVGVVGMGARQVHHEHHREPAPTDYEPELLERRRDSLLAQAGDAYVRGTMDFHAFNKRLDEILKYGDTSTTPSSSSAAPDKS